MSSNPLVEHFRGMLVYETQANERALAALDSIRKENRAGASYERAMQLLPHSQIARQVWLWRLTSTAYENPREWFPFRDTSATRTECERMDREWGAYLAKLADADLAREITYTSSEGKKYASRIGDVLTHVFNHSTYHRGQIARLVTECGGERPTTDYIVFTRRGLA